jgi:hypothetical protein
MSYCQECADLMKRRDELIMVLRHAREYIRKPDQIRYTSMLSWIDVALRDKPANDGQCQGEKDGSQ